MFGHLSYLISIILFAGAAVLIEWLFEFNLLRRYYKTILLGIGISVLLVPAEYVALSVKAWKYSPIHTVAKLFLGAEVETYLYMFFVALAIVGAVIAWTDF